MKLTSREILIFVLAALAVLLGGLLLFGLLWGWGGMLGPGMMGPGMMGTMSFFWLLLLCLLPLLLILIVAGAVWLVVSRGESRTAQRELSCPRCSRTVQPDWQVCPYCGEPLKGEGSR